MIKILVTSLLILSLAEANHKRSRSHKRYNNAWVGSGVHDKDCYTQGFSFINDTHILESCGMYGQSYFHIS